MKIRDDRPNPNQWKKYIKTPEYLKSGNDLRPYQLEGLNWLVTFRINIIRPSVGIIGEMVF